MSHKNTWTHTRDGIPTAILWWRNEKHLHVFKVISFCYLEKHIINYYGMLRKYGVIRVFEFLVWFWYASCVVGILTVLCQDCWWWHIRYSHTHSEGLAHQHMESVNAREKFFLRNIVIKYISFLNVDFLHVPLPQ